MNLKRLNNWWSRDRIVDVDLAHEQAIRFEDLLNESNQRDYVKEYIQSRPGYLLSQWDPYCPDCGDIGCVTCCEM